MFSILLLGSCAKNGCTDPLAFNYDANATKDDGSCNFQYPCPNDVDYTCIPDYVFEKALIDLGYDDIMDGQVLTANISSVDSLDVEADNYDYGIHAKITDLTGIEDFTSLKYLNCKWNKLTTLDVNNNTALTELDCHQNNDLYSLNISNLPNLWNLGCNSNGLKYLTVSNLPSLRILGCSGSRIENLDLSDLPSLSRVYTDQGQLISLDLSNCPNLSYLTCRENQLTCLNLKTGNISNLNSLLAMGNPNLNCIEVSDPNHSILPIHNSYHNNQFNFSTNCSGCF
jgi:hypothetical protein